MRQSFFSFTIEGDGLDTVAAREAIDLPCELFVKGQGTFTKNGREVVSRSTRWVYSFKALGRADVFLTKHLKVIAKKMPILSDYIKKYKVTIDFVIYEDRVSKDYLIFSKTMINLLNEIGVPFLIAFNPY